MMKVAVIGPGAMGLLYGAKLSQVADVVLIGNNQEHIRQINENAVVIKSAKSGTSDGEQGSSQDSFSVKAALSGEVREAVDLVILFTKAYLTQEALSQNINIIGENTMLLTLQNGMGHDVILKSFAKDEQILIGTTAQGSYRENAYTIVNSGLGDTMIGRIAQGDDADDDRIDEIIELFNKAGFPCAFSDSIRQMIWNKLMINASSSVLSGVLQKNQGYVALNEYAWDICKDLIREICAVAKGDGFIFDPDEQIARINEHLNKAAGGYTSIYSDIKKGRKTEVDHISGAVVRLAKEYGLKVPVQEMMVRMVHAMEQNQAAIIKKET